MMRERPNARDLPSVQCIEISHKHSTADKSITFNPEYISAVGVICPQGAMYLRLVQKYAKKELKFLSFEFVPLNTIIGTTNSDTGTIAIYRKVKRNFKHSGCAMIVGKQWLCKYMIFNDTASEKL